MEWPHAQVADDVRQGYISLRAAADLYGVVVDPNTFEVDVAATDKLRAARRSAGDEAQDVKSA
jgi:N-methylhydantoinase B